MKLEVLRNLVEKEPSNKNIMDILRSYTKENEIESDDFEEVYKADSTKKFKEYIMQNLPLYKDMSEKERANFVKVVISWQLAKDNIDYIEVSYSKELDEDNCAEYCDKTISIAEEFLSYPSPVEMLSAVFHELDHNKIARKKLYGYKKGKEGREERDLENFPKLDLESKMLNNEQSYSRYFCNKLEKQARNTEISSTLKLVRDTRTFLESENKLDEETNNLLSEYEQEILENKSIEIVDYKEAKQEYKKSTEIFRKKAMNFQARHVFACVKNLHKAKKLNPAKVKVDPLTKHRENHILFLQSLGVVANNELAKEYYNYIWAVDKSRAFSLVNNVNFSHTQKQINDVAGLLIKDCGKELCLPVMFKFLNHIDGREILLAHSKKAGEESTARSLSAMLLGFDKEMPHIDKVEKYLQEIKTHKKNELLDEKVNTFSNILYEKYSLELEYFVEEYYEDFSQNIKGVIYSDKKIPITSRVLEVDRITKEIKKKSENIMDGNSIMQENPSSIVLLKCESLEEYIKAKSSRNETQKAESEIQEEDKEVTIFETKESFVDEHSIV